MWQKKSPIAWIVFVDDINGRRIDEYADPYKSMGGVYHGRFVWVKNTTSQ